MNKDVFEFLDYKAYLRARIHQMPKAGRGVKLAMASALDCPSSHVSQVLGGPSHFSLEQAEALNAFWSHADEESEFFLLLIQYARAGSPALSKRLMEQIKKVKISRLNLKERLKVQKEIAPEDQGRFYSSWLYGAVHVMVTIPKLQTREAIASHLGISTKYAGEILSFLTSIGLVLRQGDRYTVGAPRIHLGSDSPLISKMHTNWRMKAIQSLEREEFTRDLHYSSVVTVSQSDRDLIQSILVKQIDEIKKIIRESKEEGAHCFCIDFFDL